MAEIEKNVAEAEVKTKEEPKLSQEEKRKKIDDFIKEAQEKKQKKKEQLLIDNGFFSIGEQYKINAIPLTDEEFSEIEPYLKPQYDEPTIIGVLSLIAKILYVGGVALFFAGLSSIGSQSFPFAISILPAISVISFGLIIHGLSSVLSLLADIRYYLKKQ